VGRRPQEGLGMGEFWYVGSGGLGGILTLLISTSCRDFDPLHTLHILHTLHSLHYLH
jgi:hypothetical protein